MLSHSRLVPVAVLCLAVSVSGRAVEHPLQDADAEKKSVSRELSFGDRGADVQQVYRYLRRYGYFPNAELARNYPGWRPAVPVAPADPSFFDDRMEEAIRLFQAAHGLTVDGRLNAKTQGLMQRPRCGFPDYYGFTYNPPRVQGAMVAPFAVVSSWPQTSITYSIMNYTADLPSGSSALAILGALNRWTAAAPVTFIQAGYVPDLRISWAVGNHGDDSPFTPGTSVIAHSAYPSCSAIFTCTAISGDVHFNDAKTWTVNGQPFDLRNTALHELGHSLGLGHSTISTAVMYPEYNAQIELQPDDIAGIRSLYSVMRDPRTFAAQFYLDANPDLRTAFGENNVAAASRHWIDFGRGEGRIAGAAFQVRDYLALQPDLSGYSYRAAIDHWIAYGIYEGRQGSYAFHAPYYLNRYPELNLGATNYLGAIHHWVSTGLGEGRRASPQFDPAYYLQANPDVAAAYGPTNYRYGLVHWLRYGRNENRKAVP